MRRLQFLWAVALFFTPTVSGQDHGGAFDGVYHSWQRPFVAYDTTSEVWIAAYISPDGQAYEHRDKAGDLLAVYVRFQGECYQSRDGLEWGKRSCHLFISLDAKFREAVLEHQRKQSARKTDE